MIQPLDLTNAELALSNVKRELAALGFPHGHPAVAQLEARHDEILRFIGGSEQFNKFVREAEARGLIQPPVKEAGAGRKHPQ